MVNRRKKKVFPLILFKTFGDTSSTVGGLGKTTLRKKEIQIILRKKGIPGYNALISVLLTTITYQGVDYNVCPPQFTLCGSQELQRKPSCGTREFQWSPGMFFLQRDIENKAESHS
eukprot:TRINITY_DN20830_c0_g1_i2.p1 TRINITY_DN20830_c0_g1~~TRINITY_DN20830_c0_g1_i2.p1  ORF type:complete len:116 (-),score=12.46 TRINITY_DN20830_c0_g1_i2:884-1231(-)